MPWCESTTRKGKPCQNIAEAKDDGVWRCHIHHSQMAFQCQTRSMKYQREKRARQFIAEVVHKQSTGDAHAIDFNDGFDTPPFVPDN